MSSRTGSVYTVFSSQTREKSEGLPGLCIFLPLGVPCINLIGLSLKLWQLLKCRGPSEGELKCFPCLGPKAKPTLHAQRLHLSGTDALAIPLYSFDVWHQHRVPTWECLGAKNEQKGMYCRNINLGSLLPW